MWKPELLLSFGDMRWALLLVLLVLGVFFLRGYSDSYIRKTYARVAQGSAKIRLRGALPNCFAFIGLIVTIAALMDFTRGYASIEELLAVNRFFVAADNSSSMYYFEYVTSERYNFKPEIYCTDKNLRDIYPRIYGACRALHRLIDATEAHTGRAGDIEKDRINILRFALYSYNLVPLTDDYARLRRSVNELDWRGQLNLVTSKRGKQDIYTEIHLALWDLYRLALERNLSHDAGFVPLSSEDRSILFRAFEPEGDDTPFSLPSRFKDTVDGDGRTVAGIVTRLKEELRDTVFIFITDASSGQLEQRINFKPVSLKKMLEFAALIELPVYFVSTDEANDVYKRMARKTGFTLDGTDYHGDFFVANRDEGYAHLETLVGDILKVRFGRTIPKTTERRISYAAPLSFLALTCFVLAIFFRETWSRSLTNT